MKSECLTGAIELLKRSLAIANQCCQQFFFKLVATSFSRTGYSSKAFWSTRKYMTVDVGMGWIESKRLAIFLRGSGEPNLRTIRNCITIHVFNVVFDLRVAAAYGVQYVGVFFV